MGLVIETELGKVEGAREAVEPTRRTIRVFRGIPFAAPAVGSLRFAAPAPAAPWPGVRPALAFGPSAMQSNQGPFGGSIPGNAVGEVSEDCLSLNIWTPEGDITGLPVLLWIYGGAFLIGGTSIETYDGGRLCAEHEVVVVSANYRVGVFGFLWLGSYGADTADAMANCGLLDQIAAMHWVRRNIASFGGDPANVTVFGESAGAGSLLHVMSSPRSKGAFRRLISQSAGIDHTLDAELADVATDAFLGQLDLRSAPAVIEKLRTLPAETLLAAQERAVPPLMGVVSSMPYHPVVDGVVLPAKPAVAIANGAGDEVDLLVSWTADELRLFPEPRANALSRDEMVAWTHRYLTGRLGADPGVDRARSLVEFYVERLSATTRTTGADLWAALQTDGVMRLPARRIADLRAERGAVTFCSEFGWEAKGGDWERGAFHAIDLPFVFGTLGRCGWAEFLNADAAAEDLSREIRTAWARFAREGAPGAKSTGSWPRYDTQKRPTMSLNATSGSTDDPLGEIAERWDGLWSPAGRPPTFA